MTDILLFSTIIAPIVTALVQVVKSTVAIPKNFIPIIALVVGLIVGAASVPFSDLELTLRLWAGALAGLTGVGLYEVLNQQEGKTKEGQ